MVTILTVKEAIAAGLADYMDIPVVAEDEGYALPEPPYLSYSITGILSRKGSSWSRYEDGVMRQPVTQTWSFAVTSQQADQAMVQCVKAMDWLDYFGTVALAEKGITVQSAGEVAPQTRDGQPYRCGFTAVIAFLQERTDPSAADGYIETATIQMVEQ